MPTWTETETEIRYRIRAPDVFMSGSFRVSPLQKEPSVDSIVGRIKGEDEPTTQEIRFPVDSWKLEDAKKWVEDNEEKILKMATELTTAFLEKGNLSIQGRNDEILRSPYGELRMTKWISHARPDSSDS